MSALYGAADPAVRAADAYMQRGERLEAARNAYCAEREREIVRSLTLAPLADTISGNYAYSAGDVVISHGMVAWVIQTAADPEASLAEAMFSDIARRRLVQAFAQARAEMDADAMLARGVL